MCVIVVSGFVVLLDSCMDLYVFLSDVVDRMIILTDVYKGSVLRIVVNVSVWWWMKWVI